MIDSYIPYGGYWTTPFARWQGSFSNLHSLKFAAHVARDALKRRDIEPTAFDVGVLGLTVPQDGSFYGAPWLMGEIGATRTAGPTVAQACATGARAVQLAVGELVVGGASACLVVTTDRNSNGPVLYYPAPDAPGGTGQHERWVLDNFDRDPYARVAMIRTAENVAARFGIGTTQQNEWTLCRYEQYAEAKADDSAFLKRFMTLPFEVPDRHFRKTVKSMGGDEGMHDTSAEGLARLKPLLDGGTVTYGGQTHPADGNAGLIVTARARLPEFTRQPGIGIRLVSFGQAREEAGYMPAAPVPAALRALRAAGIEAAELVAIKTHNPFIVNDIVLAKALGVGALAMNRFGSPLVWGHPIAPTGMRCLIELIEELVLIGGGYGMFTGCAAGDSAMAVVIHVGDL
nr:putative acetyl-CoA acetyltransferase [uncultured bacterium]